MSYDPSKIKSQMMRIREHIPSLGGMVLLSDAYKMIADELDRLKEENVALSDAALSLQTKLDYIEGRKELGDEESNGESAEKAE